MLGCTGPNRRRLNLPESGPLARTFTPTSCITQASDDFRGSGNDPSLPEPRKSPNPRNALAASRPARAHAIVSALHEHRDCGCLLSSKLSFTLWITLWTVCARVVHTPVD